MSSDKTVQIWEQLAQEADICKFDQMPEVVIRDLPAPLGYRAQLCMKRIPIYHRAFEVKARGWIQNAKTKEVQFSTGEDWILEKTASKRLGEALEQLFQLQAYKEAMATKQKPVSQSTSLF